MRIRDIMERLKAEAVDDKATGERWVNVRTVEEHLRKHLESAFISHHDYTGGE